MIGTRIGHYQVVARLGEGGMGEVYRAVDSNLKRAVALKVLPQAVAGDSDRLARLQREAEVLASLNHPNIAAIYGLERTNSTTALVMELVEGETLDALIRDRFEDRRSTSGSGQALAQSGGAAFDVSEWALPIVRQIVDALEFAHENGIVHRDLKPANVKVRSDGTVKVLDFGLAKALGTDGGPASRSGAAGSADPAPTLTSPAMTQVGMILGTAAYMAPEQAKGRPVDRRADVWAVGAVLYEMLTGRRAFAGDDVSEVLASVLAREPDWTLLPADAPVLGACVRRCLQRDPRQRFGDMQSLRLALEGGFGTGVDAGPSTPAAAPGSAKTSKLAWGVAAAATAAALALTVAYMGRPTEARPIVRSMIPPPDGTAFDFDVTLGPAVLSPDGNMVVFGGRSQDGRIQLFVRRLDSAEARPLDGTEGGSFPFWSPDGRSIGFYVPGRGRLERVNLAGGPPVAIVRAGFVRGASWASDGTIAYDTADDGGGIKVVPAAGGASRMISSASGPRSPWFLPDGRHLLYFKRESNQVRTMAADGTGDAAVTEATSNAIYANGYLLFMREGTLLAQPFDLSTRTVSGSPIPIARDVQMLVGEPRGVFSASGNGVLVYQDGGAQAATSLAWFDRDGKPASVVAELGAARGCFLSPDEQHAIVGMNDAEGRLDLWRVNLATRQRNRLTFGPEVRDVSQFAAWSPDGRFVAFAARQNGRMVIFRTSAAGSQAERLFDVPAEQTRGSVPRVTVWTEDAGRLLYSGTSRGGIWSLLTGPGTEPAAAAVVVDPDTAQNVQLSPDGRWVAYQATPVAATVSGIFVEAFPGGGHRQQVTDLGTLARWSADGKALYYAADNVLSVVTVGEADGALRFGPPRPLMPVIVGRGFSYDVANDGRMLALVTSERRASRPLTLVQEWPAAIGKE